MTITKEIVVPLADVLYAVTLRCQHCKTLITLDLSDPMDLANKGHFPPSTCLVCEKPFDSAWGRIDSLRAAYKELKDFGEQITFRVRFSADTGNS